ncbi:MAG: L-2-hydroxyglutarate oxidase [Methylotenera sp.]|nr:L-2-hydroxyglutarate oxidase [Methylotenera sp.]
MENKDFLIIGAGIVGLSIAKELKSRYPKAKVLVLEKEVKPGLHSSGRNSGVLHSGIYYPPNSIKAQVCRQGSVEMAEYCVERKLPISKIGKILLPVNLQDASQLDLLEQRAFQNGVVVERLDEPSLREMEPEAHSATGEAIFVPGTSVGDSVAVMKTFVNECIHDGIEIRCSVVISSVDSAGKKILLLDGSSINYGHLINAAGLHADSVSHKFGIGSRYTLLPFKGIYWKLAPDAGLNIKHLIYPVPDLRVPFLGVHTTTSVDGTVYLGPTAVPAFGRENYRGLDNVTIAEFSRISRILLQQTIAGRDGFRRLAWQEGRRYFKPWFADAARAILPRLQDKHLLPCDKVGIRAQMFDKQDKKLVNDFLVERGFSSTHILNAISPAWTSAFPFARFVIDNYIER